MPLRTRRGCWNVAHGGAPANAMTTSRVWAKARALRLRALSANATASDCGPVPYRDQSGYSSLRQARASSGSGFGVRLSRNEWYGATNGSDAITV